MNLIEQLGGYEVVKDIRKKKTSNQYLDFNGRKIHFSKIDRELLEHRRENNIFEVGDFVKANGSQFGFNELFKIDDFFADDDGINLAVLDDGDCYPLSWLAHASDKEIAQGYRDE